MSSKLEKGALGKRVAQFLDSHVEIHRDPSDMQPPHVTVAEIKQAIRDHDEVALSSAIDVARELGFDYEY